MTSQSPNDLPPSWAEIARQEFWIVAKSFFAPIYGAALVFQHLARATQAQDQALVRRRVHPAE